MALFTYVFFPFVLCDVVIGPGMKSEVSQSQSKLYPRPSQAAWTDVHPSSFAGTSRCGKYEKLNFVLTSYTN